MEIDKRSHVLIVGAFLCHCFTNMYNLHVLRISDFSKISIAFSYFEIFLVIE